MTIGIDASRAFLKRRTGIEEYAYQTIKHLRSVIPGTDTVVLYVRKKLQVTSYKLQVVIPEIDFELPEHWRVRGIWAPRFWTQVGLSIEMLLHPPDVLFVPAHTVPSIHPAKTVVTIHGLEYEFCPDGYSFWERLYMRASIRFSCRAATTVICVSENTKRDVMRLYGVPEEKTRVVYEGYETNFQFPTRLPDGQVSNFQANLNFQPACRTGRFPISKPYLLFIGRLEERKNIVRIIEAFEMLKEKYQIPHTLVLAGKWGFGARRIRYKLQATSYKLDIFLMGYVTEEEKWELLKNADVFAFPTLYEGFGIPVLEAQSVGVPVVTSNTSSLPEVAGPPTIPPDEIVLRAGGGAMFVDPYSVKNIAEGMQKVLSDKALRDGIIEKGLKNTERFSWQSCAEKIGAILRK
ncbi:MAG: glycosyltransferase family 1 protein [Patescibacteria group bacterium]